MIADHLVDIRAGTATKVRKAGSGYRVGPSLILTADHTVTEDGAPLDRVEVRLGHPADGPPLRFRATRVWARPGDRDVALLRIQRGPGDPALPPYAGPPVLWGALTGSRRVSYTGIGFPGFAEYTQGERVPEQLSGGLNPLSIGPDGVLVADQDAYPRPNEPGREGRHWWAGVSGAAVFAVDDAQGGEDLLIGVVVTDDDVFSNRRLRVLTAASFCDDDEFALQLIADGQPVPRLCPFEPGGRGTNAVEVGVPRQLPADLVGQFVGREAELTALSGLLGEAAGDAPVVAISAIGGTAGIGKSALAIRWSHASTEQFPDGQLYVNLRGFDPGGEPLRPELVIRSFLDAFGLPPDRIPSGVEAQAAFYRTLLSGKRLLLVLDNARNVDHVRPMLPGSPTVKVLVTSRDNLVGLVPMGARLITLDTLGDDDSVALLARAVGADRIEAEPTAAAELIRWCGRLPLALAVVAARAAERPTFPLQLLADELRDEHARLDALETGDSLTSVRSVFSWSYSVLSTRAARMFRLLGLATGADFGLHAAASIAGLDPGDTRAALSELTRAHMISEMTPGRYSFHDLLRAYAAETAAKDADAEERHEAGSRLLGFYLHSAFRAERRLYPHRDTIVLAPAPATISLQEFPDYAAAMDWFLLEHANLRDAIRNASELGHDVQVWQLAWCMSTFLDRHMQWRDYADTQQAAVHAAHRLGVSAVQALTHRLLATAFTFLREHEKADENLAAALRLFVAAGDGTGQARTYFNIALSQERQGRFAEAAESAARSIALYRSVGHDMGAARVRAHLGWYQALNGQLEDALASCERAVAELRELGNRWEESHAAHHLGYAHHHLGRPAMALEFYAYAAGLFEELNDPYHRSRVLVNQGDAHSALGDRGAAVLAWRRAAEILTDLGGHPDLDKVKSRIAQLNATADQARS
ncbi:tetratricopeptide repeat protein [Streptomyces nojiriensis]|uniref:tetratricopeptide repeat protein n=1 Tax=Streptomyces nojiriensis TaxID=66374 RepID=UPI002E16E4CE